MRFLVLGLLESVPRGEVRFWKDVSAQSRRLGFGAGSTPQGSAVRAVHLAQLVTSMADVRFKEVAALFRAFSELLSENRISFLEYPLTGIASGREG